jgi:hypothetical protein
MPFTRLNTTHDFDESLATPLQQPGNPVAACCRITNCPAATRWLADSPNTFVRHTG